MTKSRISSAVGTRPFFLICPQSCWNGPRTSFTVVSLDRLAYLRWFLSGPINRQQLLGSKLPMEPPSDASLSIPSVCHPPPNGSAGGQMHLSNNGRLGLSPLVHWHDCPVFYSQYLRQVPAASLLAVVTPDQSSRVDSLMKQTFLHLFLKSNVLGHSSLFS